MRTTLLLLFTLLFLNADAQKRKSDHHVQLISGETIEGKRLQYLALSNTEPVFRLDDMMIPAKDVEFFQNSHGYFANLGRIEGFDQPNFALCIDKGRAKRGMARNDSCRCIHRIATRRCGSFAVGLRGLGKENDHRDTSKDQTQKGGSADSNSPRPAQLPIESDNHR